MLTRPAPRECPEQNTLVGGVPPLMPSTTLLQACRDLSMPACKTLQGAMYRKMELALCMLCMQCKLPRAQQMPLKQHEMQHASCKDARDCESSQSVS